MKYPVTFLIALLLAPRAALHATEPFDLQDVKLLDGPFRDAQERDKGYILRVQPDRLMHWWRVNNGLPPLTKLGVIGPAKTDGTFRDVTFPIPASLIAGKDHLIVRFIRQKNKTPGLVAEARVLRD